MKCPGVEEMGRGRGSASHEPRPLVRRGWGGKGTSRLALAHLGCGATPAARHTLQLNTPLARDEPVVSSLRLAGTTIPNSRRLQRRRVPLRRSALLAGGRSPPKGAGPPAPCAYDALKCEAIHASIMLSSTMCSCCPASCTLGFFATRRATIALRPRREQT